MKHFIHDMTNSQIFGAMAVIVFLIPFVWERLLRERLGDYLEHHTIVEWESKKYIFLSKIYHKHTLITGALIAIGALFAILALF